MLQLSALLGRLAGAKQGQQHLEAFDGVQLVGHSAGHENQLAGLDGYHFAADGNLGLAVENLYIGIEGRGVFGEALALVKTEDGQGADFVLLQGATDHGAFLVVDHGGQFGGGGGGHVGRLLFYGHGNLRKEV